MVCGELIGVPAKQSVASVSIDTSEHAVGRSKSEFVLKGMAGECAKKR